jgi:hypothetical protein
LPCSYTIQLETMRAGIIIVFFTLALGGRLTAQEKCAAANYQTQELARTPLMKEQLAAIENFTNNHLQGRTTSRLDGTVIKIPVVVHILYHTQTEKITDQQVIGQIEALNRYFRRRNSDTMSTPLHFRQLAADVEIEFQLAKSDPKKRYTTGINRKYTPITKWGADDQMKFASTMGADAWDANSYLNIWVCNLDKFAGYATMPGGDITKDGIVISYRAFGTGNNHAGYDQGKTAVHEVGHWLNLKHIWGDTYCGDDGVHDTPKQASYTVGCPTTVRVTCGNAPYGDMYMNFMDFTSDACVNMFTQGQKTRMRSLFENGGARAAILLSKGLNNPLIFETPLPEEDPKWLHAQLYPNPASSEIFLDLAYDIRWMGKTIFVTNVSGQSIMNVTITSKKQRIDISKLQPGIYFLAAKKDDGESIKQRFIKF